MSHPASILIVDDEPTNFDVIEALLESEGYHLFYASNASATLTSLQNYSIDVILLDVMMPEMDGITLCSQIKTYPEYQYIPIIIVTALTSKTDLARALEAGANDFISKPLNGMELRSRVHSMLRIKRQYDELQLLLKRREEMAEIIVHDLQNPVSSIVLSSEMLKSTELDQRQQKKVEQIRVAGKRLEEQIQTLLTMAKLETGRLALNPDWIHLKPLLNQLIQDFSVIAASKEIAIVPNFQIDDDLAVVDSHLFSRIINNLLSNALKYSPRRSTIEVQLHNKADQIMLKVIDEGQGISDASKQKIFNKYETGACYDDIQQTGLGLSFCKMAVTAHYGQIYVEDNSPQGAIFIVEIPREASFEAHFEDNANERV